jgi:hypothetical protein
VRQGRSPSARPLRQEEEGPPSQEEDAPQETELEEEAGTMKRILLPVFVAAVGLIIAASAVAAINLERFDVTFTGPNGEAVAEAGSHPFAMTTSLEVTSETSRKGTFPTESVKDLLIGEVPGFVGDPTAVPPCPAVDFLERVPGTADLPECANSSAVGVATAIVGSHAGKGSFIVPLYNLSPTPGSVARLGFIVETVPVTVEVGVSQEWPYRVVGAATQVSQALEFFGAELTIWGVPADPRHDKERGTCRSASSPQEDECPAEVAEKPFLTVPRACAGQLSTTYQLDTWQHPAAWVSGSVPTPAAPAGFTGCEALGFAPAISTAGSNPAAESPTGLDFDLGISDPGLTEVGARANSDPERVSVTLPEGFVTNPSVASGLAACSQAQYEESGITFNPHAGCPQASKIGTVEVTSPLLEETVDGQVYVAKQGENPFHSLLALYMILRNERYGLLVKQPLKVEPDPKTGRLTTIVDQIPQLPFSDFHLDFREGQRAPLITPPTCGTFTAQADLTPYSNPGNTQHETDALKVTGGANGAGCASSASQLPNAPSFSAGTVEPTAGSYSPFVLKLSRADGSQQFSSVSTTLPKGLVGKLAGIPYCSDAQIAQASGRGGEFEGGLEQRQPSCPQSSEVGTVTATAGAGSEPLSVHGHAYLAGPYKGAPLSLEIVTPAIAGPFDVGTVAIRTALQVNPETAEITAVSDPIPTILYGLPLDVRSIAIDMNRPNFTLNPTSCGAKAIAGSVISTQGSSAAIDQYFQAANCRALKFKPKLKISLKGSTTRTGHPALKAVVTYPKGGAYANIARAQVNLPHSVFLEQSNLNKTCTKPVLLEGKCPKSSVYGKAKAWTPLLDKPLQGNVYLVGGFGYELPALVAELNGQIRVLLKGKVDSGPNKGIRNTFEAVPDAPVEKFVLEMKGGPKYSLLVNSENLCAKPQKAIARFTAQNGKVLETKSVIEDSCKQGSKGAKKKSNSPGKKKHRSGKNKAGSGHKTKNTSRAVKKAS